VARYTWSASSREVLHINLKSLTKAMRFYRSCTISSLDPSPSSQFHVDMQFVHPMCVCVSACEPSKRELLDDQLASRQIDDQNVHGMSVGEVSGLIRGKEGSLVFIHVRKADGQVRKVRLVRERQPGSKTELLGALWQSNSNSSKSAKQVTAESKLDVLKQLRSRGNLTEEEYQTAVQRLQGGRPQLQSSLSSGSGDHWFDSGRGMP